MRHQINADRHEKNPPGKSKRSLCHPREQILGGFQVEIFPESSSDGNGVRQNLDDWNTGNKQHTAEKMLRVTGLASKAGVDKEKASDKIKGVCSLRDGIPF